MEVTAHISDIIMWRFYCIFYLLFLFFLPYKNDYYCFSSITFPHLLQLADTNFARLRLKPAIPDHEFLVPGREKHWGKNKPVNKEIITKAVAGEFAKPKFHEKDRTMMKQFLNNIDKTKFTVPNIAPLKNIMPIPTPVFDSVRNVLGKPGTWSYPPKQTWEGWSVRRAVCWNSVDEVDVRETYLGVSSEEEVWNFINWMDDCYDRNQRELHSEVLSLDVEEVRISHWDYKRITCGRYIGQEIELSRKLNVCTEEEKEMFANEPDRWRNLPVKIMLGDGIQWMGLISFKMRYSGPRKWIKIGELQPELLDLIHVLPVVTGVGVKGDVEIIETTFSDMSGGQPVKMKGFLDLSTMAVMAGWRLEARNMTAMAMVGLGVVMNKISSIADSLWGLPYAQLPKEFKAYAIGDIKVGHLLYVTLFSAMMIEAFPDPDAVCYVTGVTQEIFQRYFAEWLSSALINKVVYEEHVKTATTRRELLSAIRYQTRNGRVSVDVPEKVRQFAERILKGNPTVTYGGPRFLHKAREDFISQFQELKTSKVDFEKDLFSREISAIDKIYLRYGYDSINNCDHSLPIDAADYTRALVSHPDLRLKEFKVD